MNEKECEKLSKKYNELVSMVEELFEQTLEEYKDKSKRNETFIHYKKRVYEELQRLKKEIIKKDSIIEAYKRKNLEYSKENFALKHKFKHLSHIFKNEREVELLNKYFPNREKLEKIISKSIKELISIKFNPKNSNTLYFRKYFYVIMREFIAKEINKIIHSEKLSLILSGILLKEYEYFIRVILAQELLNRVDDEKFEEFLESLIKDNLLDTDNNKKYLPIKLDYTIDEIKQIVEYNLKFLSKSSDTYNLSTEIEMKEILEEKEKNLLLKKQFEEELNHLKQIEDEILSEIVSNKEEKADNDKKGELEKIDEDKRIIKENLIKLESELKKLQNREMFLQPLLELKSQTQDSKMERYQHKYEKLITDFAESLKDLK